jgi:hypothetical protein
VETTIDPLVDPNDRIANFLASLPTDLRQLIQEQIAEAAACWGPTTSGGASAETDLISDIERGALRAAMTAAAIDYFFAASQPDEADLARMQAQDYGEEINRMVLAYPFALRQGERAKEAWEELRQAELSPAAIREFKLHRMVARLKAREGFLKLSRNLGISPNRPS